MALMIVLTALNVLFTLVMVNLDSRDATSKGFNDGFELGWSEGLKASADDHFEDGFNAGWDECEKCYDVDVDFDEMFDEEEAV